MNLLNHLQDNGYIPPIRSGDLNSRDYLELDKLEVFKCYYGNEWERVFRQAIEDVLFGDIDYTVDFIIKQHTEF